MKNRVAVEIWGRLIGEMIIFFSRKKYKTALQNVSFSFPEKDEKWVRWVVRRSFYEFGMCIAEIVGWIICGWRYKDADVYLRRLLGNIVKDEISDDLYIRIERRGALILTGHFSNFILIPLWFKARGIRTSVVLKRMRNNFLQKMLEVLINKVGIYPLYVSDIGIVRKIKQEFDNNAVVVALLDQHFGKRGRVEVDFFGRKAYAASGIIRIAQQSKRDIFGMFVERENFGFRIFDVGKFSAQGSDLVVREFTRRLEEIIRKKPFNWAWMHRRWKVG